MVGAVVQLRTVLVCLTEALAQVDKADVFLLKEQLRVIEIHVVVIGIVHERQLVGGDIAGGRREHDGHGSAADGFLEIGDRGEVLLQIIVGGDRLVDQIAVLGVIHAVRAVIAERQGVIAVEAYPHVALRKMVGKIGLEFFAEFAAGDVLEGSLREFLQIAFLRGTVVELRREDEPYPQSEDEHHEHQRRQKAQLAAFEVGLRLAVLVDLGGQRHRVFILHIGLDKYLGFILFLFFLLRIFVMFHKNLNITKFDKNSKPNRRGRVPTRPAAPNVRNFGTSGKPSPTERYTYLESEIQERIVALLNESGGADKENGHAEHRFEDSRRAVCWRYRR